ncbi:hypothetical protein BGZ94_003705 [Podila epigama]|nr:hypothetical protein BGZ94_003705 [Podila epigama]
MVATGFQAVLTCLSRIGDDVVMVARPDSLVLTTINITRSAHANFCFTRNFFETFHLDVRSNIMHDNIGPYLRCKVLAKALVSACKVRGNVEQKIEKCCIFMDSAEGVGENCRLTIELIFKYGFIKIHKLLYESCLDNMQVLYSKDSFPSSWRLTPPALMGLIDNFSSKAEEISMECNENGIILSTCKGTHDIEGVGSRRIGTTSVPINRSAMDSYVLGDAVDVVFSLKEFKAIVSFAVTLRLPLDGYFDSRSRPILLSANSENILSAIRHNGHAQSQNQARAGEDHEQMDLTQPENALFLEDDTNWEAALGEFEMEEALSNSGTQGSSSVVPGGAQHANSVQNTPAQAQGSCEPTQIKQLAEEIDEREFVALPQRGPKRRKFIFDDDDDDDEE